MPVLGAGAINEHFSASARGGKNVIAAAHKPAYFLSVVVVAEDSANGILVLVRQVHALNLKVSTGVSFNIKDCQTPIHGLLNAFFKLLVSFSFCCADAAALTMNTVNKAIASFLIVVSFA